MTDTTDTPSTPEGGEPNAKPKGWIKRHPVWAGVIAAGTVGLIASAAAGGADSGDSGNRSNNEVATTTTEDVEPVEDPVDEPTTTSTVVVDTAEEISTEAIEEWVMNGDGLDVAEWMGNIGVDAAALGLVSTDVEMQSGCVDAYAEYFEGGDILPKMQSAPGELGEHLEDAFFAFEQGFRLCTEGDYFGAVPALNKGTEHLTQATDILSRYSP
jgi:hypothetical protein